MSKKGFSLIELLVAITILAVLSTVGLTVFSTSQRRSRDSRRRADLKAIQNAFEQYYSEGNVYSSTCAGMASGYLQGNAIPTGPKGETYVATCASDSYCLCATLEVEGSGNADDSACAFSSTGSYFCITSLQ